MIRSGATDAVRTGTTWAPGQLGMPMRLYSSRDNSAAVLALKMAECSMVRRSPAGSCVLLDDVTSGELDAGRRDYLLNHLDNRQVFVTCCDDASFRGLKGGSSFLLHAGQLVRTERFLGKGEGMYHLGGDIVVCCQRRHQDLRY